MRVGELPMSLWREAMGKMKRSYTHGNDMEKTA